MRGFLSSFPSCTWERPCPGNCTSSLLPDTHRLGSDDSTGLMTASHSCADEYSQMLRHAHQPPRHRVVVQVVEILFHRGIRGQFLWMETLLPEFVPTCGLASGAEVRLLVGQLFAILVFDPGEESTSHMAFEVGQHALKVRHSDDGVEAGIEDRPSRVRQARAP